MSNLRTGIVKTRKVHICFACKRLFPKGTEMQLQTNVYGGEIYNIYTCETCGDLLYEYPHLFETDDEFQQGCVKEYISQYNNGDTPEELLDKLVESNYKDD